MRITEVMRMDGEQVWSGIVKHPFVVELYEGVLPDEKFRYYLLQDYAYLNGLIRSLCVIASKSDRDLMRRVLSLAHSEVTIEMENYRRMLSQIDLSLADAMSVEPAPTNVAYTNFLLSSAYSKSPLVGLAALLPCFWSYAEIAERHRGRLEHNGNQLYRQWASVYLADETKDLVEEIRVLVDEVEDPGDAEKAFMIASRYEFMFWEMAYRLEGWSI
jgi:thiaminase/transcriptional activator TenA